jgi:hypothetical protein
MKKILALTAAGVAIAVSFTLIGMSMGISAADSEYAKLPPACTVDDQELASFRRAREIDQQLEKKIDMKVRILADVGQLKTKKQELAFEIERKESKLLLLKVETTRLERAIAARKAEEL